MSRVYEVMFIVRPDVEDEEVDKLIAGFSTTVKTGGGVVKTVEKLGRRKLAYMVRRFNDGNYVLLTIEANGAVVLELERRLRVTEPVIKFITVRMDEEEKRLAKVKAAARRASARRAASRQLLLRPLKLLLLPSRPRLLRPTPEQASAVASEFLMTAAVILIHRRRHQSSLPRAHHAPAGKGNEKRKHDA